MSKIKGLHNEHEAGLAKTLRNIASVNQHSKIDQLRDVFDLVEDAKAKGASNQEIVDGLAKHGLIFDVPNFKNARSRIQRERAMEEGEGANKFASLALRLSPWQNYKDNFRYAHDLILAVHIHVGYTSRCNEEEKNRKVEELLIFGLAVPVLLLYELSKFPHDVTKRFGWVDSKGLPSVVCPDVITLLTPMFAMKNFQLKTVVMSAFEVLKPGQPLPDPAKTEFYDWRTAQWDAIVAEGT